MKNLFSVLIVLTISANSFSQFKNIKLVEQDDKLSPPVDPSIAINKKDSKNIVAGVAPNRIITSTDGGTTWTANELKSLFGVDGNPAVISNWRGHLFYFHSADPSGKGRGDDAWLDRIVCHALDEETGKWNDGASIGNNPPADQTKAWPAVHPKRNEVFVTWTQFDKYGSTDPGCQTNIMFSKSPNGNKWSKQVQINQDPGDCQNDDNSAKGAMSVIGLDGKIYVTWANHEAIYFDRSYDDGSNWVATDLKVYKQVGGWAMDIPGINRCNGLPVLAIDNTEKRYSGTLYMLFADQKNGPEDTDVWLMRSRNRGDSWSVPLRVNKDEPGKHQFFPRIAVDQVNGRVYIVYYDRRNHDDLQTDVYLAYSFDGGNSFQEIKISETPFIPDASKPLGDYINIDAHEGIITPIWTRMDNGKTSVWTSIIKDSDLPPPPQAVKKQ